MSRLRERVEWHLRTQLERPSNYDRRVVLDADDVEALLQHLPDEGGNPVIADLSWDCEHPGCGAGIEVIGRDAAAFAELRTYQQAHLSEHVRRREEEIARDEFWHTRADLARMDAEDAKEGGR